MGLIEGRYGQTYYIFKQYFSEYGFIKYRLYLELKYLNNNDDRDKIMDIFNIDEEKKINHDIKSIEYYIKDKFREKELNNTLLPIIINNSITLILLHILYKLRNFGCK